MIVQAFYTARFYIALAITCRNICNTITLITILLHLVLSQMNKTSKKHGPDKIYNVCSYPAQQTGSRTNFHWQEITMIYIVWIIKYKWELTRDHHNIIPSDDPNHLFPFLFFWLFVLEPLPSSLTMEACKWIATKIIKRKLKAGPTQQMGQKCQVCHKDHCCLKKIKQ